MRVNNGFVVWREESNLNIIKDGKHYIVDKKYLEKNVFSQNIWDMDVQMIIFNAYKDTPEVIKQYKSEYRLWIRTLVDKLIQEFEPEPYKVYNDKDGDYYYFSNKQRYYLYKKDLIKEKAINYYKYLKSSGEISTSMIDLSLKQARYYYADKYMKGERL